MPPPPGYSNVIGQALADRRTIRCGGRCGQYRRISSLGVRSSGSPTSSAIPTGFHVPCPSEPAVNTVWVPSNRYRRAHQNHGRGNRTLREAVPYYGGSDTVLRGKKSNDLAPPRGHNPCICGLVAAIRDLGSTSDRYRTTGESYRTTGEGSPYYGGNLTVLRGKGYRTTREEMPYHGGRTVSFFRLPMGIAGFEPYLLVLLTLLCLCSVNNRGSKRDTLATGRGTGGEAP